MKRLISYSKIFQLILILIFILPFFKACQLGGPSAKELEAQAIADSTKLADSLAKEKILNIKEINENPSNKEAKIVTEDSICNDTIKNDSTCANDPRLKRFAHEMIDNIDTRNKEVSFFNRINNDSIKITRLNYENRKSYTTELIEKHSFLKPVLEPYDGHSGIGFMIDYWFCFIYLFGVYVSFLLSLFVFLFKLIDYNRYLVSNIIISLSGFIFLFNTYGSSFNYGSYLWGYWVCLLIWILLLIFDIIILGLVKKNK